MPRSYRFASRPALLLQCVVFGTSPLRFQWLEHFRGWCIRAGAKPKTIDGRFCGTTKQAAEKSIERNNFVIVDAAGAKAPIILGFLLARLKPCPCYKTFPSRVFPRPVKSCPGKKQDGICRWLAYVASHPSSKKRSMDGAPQCFIHRGSETPMKDCYKALPRIHQLRIWSNTFPCQVCRGLSPPGECARPGAPNQKPGLKRVRALALWQVPSHP